MLQVNVFSPSAKPLSPAALLRGAGAEPGVNANNVFAVPNAFAMTNANRGKHGPRNNARSFLGILSVSETQEVDYTFQAFVRSDDDDMSGVLFRATSANSFYVFAWGGADLGRNNLVLLRKTSQSGSKVQLWSKPARRERRRWYLFAVHALGNTFKLYVDGKLVGQVTDKASAVRRGGVAGSDARDAHSISAFVFVCVSVSVSVSVSVCVRACVCVRV